MDAECTTIREVDPASAEAVLTVRVSIPRVVEGAEDEYHLARTKPPALVVMSRTVRSDGSVTKTGTIECGAVVAHCTRADGRTADGQGRGYGKTVSVVGRSADEVAVRLSMYWAAGDEGYGELDEELLVPWLGSARAELAGGAWAAAEITPAGGGAEPHDASVRRP